MDTDPSRRRFLALRPAEPPRPAITIGRNCFTAHGIVCLSCADHCPEGAIRFRPRLGTAGELRLDDARCTGCGECVPVCPAGAIQMRPTHV